LPKINAKQALVTAAMGLTGVFCFNFFFFTALEKVTASKVALIVSLSPILTALAVSLILKERLSFQRWCGILLAFLGVSIVITQGQVQDTLHYFTNSFESGEGFMMLSVSSWVAYTVLGRFALVGLTPLQATTYAALWGTAALFLATLSDIDLWQASMVTWENTLAILYIAIFGTVVASLWFLQGVRTLGPARTAVYANLTPIFGVVLGYLVLSEPIDLSMIVGGAIVILGVTLTNRARA
jgi:drug/metabolite transporter (DMT)-like permease